MRQAYSKMISHERVTKESGMLIDIKVVNDPIRGRGIVTTHAVSKGTQLWADTQSVTFDNRADFVAFLQQLDHRLQCDILLWAYPYHGRAMVDLDVGSFINHADTLADINMDDDGYATRDIVAGECYLLSMISDIQREYCSWHRTTGCGRL